MPWTAHSAHLSPIAKLAMLQSALEAAFRDNLVIRDQETGEVLYSNRKESATWQWVGGAEKSFCDPLAAASLPDDVGATFVDGLEMGEGRTLPVVAKPVQTECLWSVATGAGSSCSEDGDAVACADGPLDRLRAVDLRFPFLQSTFASMDRPATVLSCNSNSPQIEAGRAETVPPHITATVVSDPFQRQMLIAKVFNVVPSMLLIAREMDDKGTPHVIFLNDCMVDATGFSNEDVVVAPESSLGDLPPAGIVRLVYPADIPVVLGFVRSFFQEARRQIVEEQLKRRNKQTEHTAARSAVITQFALEASVTGTSSKSPEVTVGSDHHQDSRFSTLSCDTSLTETENHTESSAISSGGLPRHQHRSSNASAMVFPGCCPPALPTPENSPPASVSQDGSNDGLDDGYSGFPLEIEPRQPVVRPAIEFRLMLANGSHIWVRGEAAAITCPFDGMTKLALTMVNIEERRDLRHQLEDEKNVVASIVAQLPVAVAVAQLDGKQRWNSEYARVLGLPSRLASPNPNSSPTSLGSGSGGFGSGLPSCRKLPHTGVGSSDCVLYRMPSDADISRSRAAASGSGCRDSEAVTGAQQPPTAQTEIDSHAASSASAGLADDYHALLRNGLLKPYEARNYPLARSIVSGSSVESERAVIHNTVTGEFTPVMISSSAVRSARGELVASVATIQDISSVVREEKAKGELVVAEQAAAATRDLLSVASHESRTPLAAILAMTGFLEDGPLTVEQKECVDAIKESGRLLLTLISDLLDFNRIEAGKLELERRLFSPYELLRHVTKMMSSYGKARDVKVELVTPGDEGDLFRRSMVLADSQRLSQIIFNLVSNACKFSNVGGTVTITASAKVAASAGPDEPSDPPSSGGVTSLTSPPSTENKSPRRKIALVIRVVDRGTGMSPAALNKVRMFLPFTQAESGTARKAGGFGLGLNISNKLLGLMEGQLEVDSIEGQGSTFGFSVAFPGEVTEASPMTSPVPRSSPSPVPLRARVLKLAPLDVSQRSGQRSPGSPLGSPAQAQAQASLSARGAQASKAESFTLRAPASPLAGSSSRESRSFSPKAAPVKLTALQTEPGSCDLFTWQGMQPLPALPAEVVVNAATPLKLQPAAVSSRRRILVAEDNKTNQTIMLRYLQKLGYASGSDVTVVEDGKQAVEEVSRAFLSGSERPYDLVLMDCQMPEFDGYYGTKAIRALPYDACKDVPVVAVTASTLPQDIERAASSGFSGHLAKPFSVEELRATVGRWLPAISPSPSASGHESDGRISASPSSAMLSRHRAGSNAQTPEDAPVPTARTEPRHTGNASPVMAQCSAAASPELGAPESSLPASL